MTHGITRLALAALLAASLASCGTAGPPAAAGGAAGVPDSQARQARQPSAGPYTSLEQDFHDTDIGCDLAVTGSMDLAWAKRYTVDYLEGGYALVCVADGHRYLVVPAGEEVPAGLADDVCAISAPLSDVYLVASDTMCVFDALGALDKVSVSGLERDDWHVEGARAAMDAGDIVFGGKYRAPDYELLLERGVKVAVESTMINHTPEVADKLRELEIPVITELSSYEPEPLGRLEWVRLWGLLLGRQQEASALMDAQQALVEAASGPALGKTVAFFYLNGQGSAVVRRPGDYVSRMIELAGGTYAFADLEPSAVGGTTVTLDTETFYEAVRDADVIVYNGSIDSSVTGVDDLIERQGCLADARAVLEGEVWACDESMYQQMVHTGDIVSDLHGALTGAEGDLTYLRHLD